jgi:hypothetical protein
MTPQYAEAVATVAREGSAAPLAAHNGREGELMSEGTPPDPLILLIQPLLPLLAAALDARDAEGVQAAAEGLGSNLADLIESGAFPGAAQAHRAIIESPDGCADRVVAVYPELAPHREALGMLFIECAATLATPADDDAGPQAEQARALENAHPSDLGPAPVGRIGGGA